MKSNDFFYKYYDTIFSNKAYTNEFNYIIESWEKYGKHAFLFPNGSLTLVAALILIGLKRGDEVIIPDTTFIASAQSVIIAGGVPVFVDVDKQDSNISTKGLEGALSERTKGIMPVHIYGQSADMDMIMRFAKRHKLWVVEDAAQGIGVDYNGIHTGTFGDFGSFSFFADKTITTGEGGLLVTNNDELAEKVSYYKAHGANKRGVELYQFVGTNYRFTDLQAAIGVAQMDRLPEIINSKIKLEQSYTERLADVEQIRMPQNMNRGDRIPYRINIICRDATNLHEYMRSNGIGTRRIFYPMHRQPCYNNQNSRFIPGIKNSLWWYDNGLSLPSGIMLTDKQLDIVCDTIKNFYHVS